MFYVRGKKDVIAKEIPKQIKEFRDIVKKLPKENECYKFISRGGFSSIAIICEVALQEGIKNLYASSLVIGKNELQTLIFLKNQSKLEYAFMVVGRMMEKNASESEYGYFDFMVDTCKEYSWDFQVAKNHSKVILIESCKGNKYVVETSSNLNKNPSIEQFSFELDVGLFEFYKEFLMSLRCGENE